MKELEARIPELVAKEAARLAMTDTIKHTGWSVGLFERALTDGECETMLNYFLSASGLQPVTAKNADGTYEHTFRRPDDDWPDVIGE